MNINCDIHHRIQEELLLIHYFLYQKGIVHTVHTNRLSQVVSVTGHTQNQNIEL